jgi:hypothetical protein
VITSHLGIAVTVNAALWAYFLKSYVEQTLEPQHLLIVSAISSLLLGLWRYYTRYLDNHLASLYPQLLLSEGILGVPPKLGTSGYLTEEVKGTERILNSNFGLEQRVNAISYIVKKRQIGNRGHLGMDVFVVCWLFLFFVLSCIYAFSVGTFFSILYLVGRNLSGFIFLFLGMARFQGKLDESCVDEALKKIHKPQNSHYPQNSPNFTLSRTYLCYC